MHSFESIRNLSVGKKLATIPLFFLMGAVAIMSCSWYGIRGQDKSAGAMNVAGRQRMLNQRHAKEVVSAAAGIPADYNKTRSLLVASAEALINGGTTDLAVLEPAPTPEIRSELVAQREMLDQVFQAADSYLAGVTSRGATKAEADRFESVTADFHDSAHGCVMSLQSYTQSGANSALMWAVGLGCFTICACTAWSWCVNRTIVRQLTQSAGSLKTVASQRLNTVGTAIRSDAEHVSNQASQARASAEQVSSNARSLTTAVEQFEASIREISTNTTSAASIARTAVDATESTNATVTRLGESSVQIGNVIKVINSIAEQTNLLALNATIEAARAGEAGKGFAVVANEVKELAKETSKATEDIITQIEGIQGDTKEAVEAIGRVSDVIGQINESQNAIASAVEEQTAMTAEISRNIAEVAQGSSEIADNISTVADAARNTSDGTQETIRTAGDIEGLADELLQLVGEVQQEFGRPTSEPASTSPASGRYRLAEARETTFAETA